MIFAAFPFRDTIEVDQNELTRGASLEAIHLLDLGGAKRLNTLGGELAVALVKLNLVLGLRKCTVTGWLEIETLVRDRNPGWRLKPWLDIETLVED